MTFYIFLETNDNLYGVSRCDAISKSLGPDLVDIFNGLDAAGLGG